MIHKKGQTMTREHFLATAPTHEDETAPSAVLRAAKKGAAVAALMPAALFGVTGCSSDESAEKNPAPATANSEGWTSLWSNEDGPRISKRCDDSNLVYRDNYVGSIAVSPNDPQCTGKTPENVAGTPSSETTATDLATAIPTPLPTHE